MESGQQQESGRPAGWFKPGVSGNPGGRPKRSDIQNSVVRMSRIEAQKAIELLMSKAIRRVERALASKDESIGLRAALEVIDRSLGKAITRIEGNVTTETVTTVSVEMLQQAARRLLAAQATDVEPK